MIQKIVALPSVTVPGLGAIDLSITNSVAAMLLAALLIITFYAFAGKGAVVPGRLQTVGEMLYGIVDGLTELDHRPRRQEVPALRLHAVRLRAVHEPAGHAVRLDRQLPGLHRDLAAGRDPDPGRDGHPDRHRRRLRQERPEVLQAVRPVGRAVAAVFPAGADRDPVVPDPPDHPGAFVCSATCWAATWC
jgi:hypothetical protein